MCVLCGEMITSFHWSDVRFNESGSEIVAGQFSKERMRLRLKRVKILNEILAFYGLKLADWQGSKYILSDKKGRNCLVGDLGDLWQKAADLSGRDFDALSADLLKFLGENFGENSCLNSQISNLAPNKITQNFTNNNDENSKNFQKNFGENAHENFTQNSPQTMINPRENG